MNKNRFDSRGFNRNRGVVLIAVLVCIGVVATILFGVVEQSLRCRRQMRNETQLEQVRWLVDAGVRKAITELEQAPGYEGERFVVAPAIYDNLNANVEIKVKPVESDSDRVRVAVTATLCRADQETAKLKRTKEFVFDRALAGQ